MDGIYDSDPEKNSAAVHFPEISFSEVLKSDLKVMDLTAITLCKENNLPLVVFNMNKKGNLKRLVAREAIGSVVAKTASSNRTT